MFIQNKIGIYVYRYVRNPLSEHYGFDVTYYESLSKMFCKYSEIILARHFTTYDRIYFNLSEADRLARNRLFYKGDYAGYMAAYDENGRLLRSDYLVGQYRKWIYDRLEQSNVRTMIRRNGSKRKAYGHYRRIRTFQERSQFFVDPYAEEQNIKIKMRAGRRGKNLPSSWDDIYSTSQKCWKKQSKRERQYHSN